MGKSNSLSFQPIESISPTSFRHCEGKSEVDSETEETKACEEGNSYEIMNCECTTEE